MPTRHRLIRNDPIVQFHVDADDRHAVDQLRVDDRAVTVSVPTVSVRVFIAVGTVTGVETIARFPAVGHLIQVGIDAPW